MSVYRIYVEKKPAFAQEAAALLGDLRTLVPALTGLRLLNRYDVEGIDAGLFDRCRATIFSEPQLDDTCDQLPPHDGPVFAVEYLPGQFDQRADSCAQCIQIVSQGERPAVRTARVYLLEGSLTPEEVEAVKRYVINPVESREAALEPADTLDIPYDVPPMVATLTGFTGLDDAGLAGMIRDYGLAMDLGDIRFCQAYFRDEEHRDPTLTELRMIDTYWSDHCRHTTFGTIIDKADIADPAVQEGYDRCLAMRRDIGRDKPLTLMELATLGARWLKAKGLLSRLDESEEINACTVKTTVDVDGKEEDWLFLFKNETHNHPTEIEPFGGAATCIGGAIRDPLSGRAYVYQAMRVTGAANPLTPLADTMPGKLPQRRLTTTAAAGYSSYGNQIGLSTGLVDELYHPGYVAKRMEIGAVVGAAPAANVRRERPAPGDIVVLLGGRTGRDGCGGATGSSKSHDQSSLAHCGAEVQKGNAPEERKLQRLFRDPEATRMIKRCNDFGAGGVSVAIGELADGLAIDLNAVPKKYEGLDGTELAISESQERMAVVLAPEDVEAFRALARRENLEATVVASVTEAPRLTMDWNGVRIVDLSRAFLNSNGAEKHTAVSVAAASLPRQPLPRGTLTEQLTGLVTDLNLCSRQGLCERFDSTIGAATILMPFGGKYQLTPAQVMAAKLPVLSGETSTCSVMAYGFNPFLTEASPYLGSYLAVADSVAKLVAAGANWHECYLTFQEYFEKLGSDPVRWGKPFAALLGALAAQADLGIAAIGGKDSMSGSFEDIHVPPTLVSFAVSISKTGDIISPEFKRAGSAVCLLAPKEGKHGLPDPDSLKANFDLLSDLIRAGKVTAAWAAGCGGAAEAIFKMTLGNRLGFAAEGDVDAACLFDRRCGAFVLELAEGQPPVGRLLGRTTDRCTFEALGQSACLCTLREAYEGRLEPVFPIHARTQGEEAVEAFSHAAQIRPAPHVGVKKPLALIPVFPGTNCEYDTARALEEAGAQARIFVVNNLTPAGISQSVAEMARLIGQAQMIVLPGGFSGGDEPDGSGKFITSFFRNPAIRDQVHELLKQRDGLMCGICNGFQALIKLGLVPYGEIIDTDENCPTLTYNLIGRHQSRLVTTRVASNQSPWLARCGVGDLHTVAISHGEGRFVASPELVRRLAENGQIATQYTDLKGTPTMDIRFNPNGSVFAIEGITSPDGRVFGKMGHSERKGSGLYKNVPGCKDNGMFAAAVKYWDV